VAARVPRAVDAPIYALWERLGGSPEVHLAGALGFDVEAVL